MKPWLVVPLVFTSCLAQAQTHGVAPNSKLDLHLEQNFGGDSSVLYFVVRGSRLYFVCNTPNGSVALVTNKDGITQSAVSLGSEKILGFDVDDEGDSYVLYGGTQITRFDRQWGTKQIVPVQPPATTITVVGGKLMGIRENARLGFLENDQPGFTLEAYPAPWMIFSDGPDRVGILRPKAPMLHVFQVDGIWSDHNGLGKMVSGLHPVDAAAGPNREIYLLGAESGSGVASIIACDEHAHPYATFEVEVPPAFRPSMIRVAAKWIYLADNKGQVVSYHLSSGSAAATPIDVVNPELITDLEPIRQAALSSGYTGKVVFHLEVGEDGSTGNLRVEPSSLNNVAELVTAAQKLRFKPMLKSGKATSTPMTMEIHVN